MDELEKLLPTIKFTKNRGYTGNKKKGEKIVPLGLRTMMTKDLQTPEILMFGMIKDINTRRIQPARGSRFYPEIDALLRKIAAEHFPRDFTYTNFQINKNVNCKMHYDKKNKGNSYTFTLGDFTSGGHLQLEDKTVDVYKRPYCFDGSKVLHSTQDWSGGDRYCIIFYTGPDLKNPKLLESFDILKPTAYTDYVTCNEIFKNNIYKTDRYFKSGETWLDIGANIGAFTLSALQAGCRVVAYEPVERNIAKLRELQSKYSFTLKEVAVSDKEGKLPIYLDRKGEWRHTLYKTRGRETREVEVIDAANLEDADGIKIDAEGSEVDIIYRLTKWPKYLLLEYDGEHHKKLVTYNKLIEFLYQHYDKVDVSNPPPANAERINFFPNGITILCSDRISV